MNDAVQNSLKPLNWKNIEFYTRNVMNGLSAVITAYEKRAPSYLKRVTGFLFLAFASITPSVPVDLKHHSSSSRGWRICWVSALICLAYDFGLTAVVTYFSGTLYGHDPSVRYFLKDRSNLVDYLFICPAYIGTCCWIIYLLVSKSKIIAQMADELSDNARNIKAGQSVSWQRMNVIRMALNFIRHHAIFPIAVIIFTFITTRYYIYDTLHSTEIHHRYWFMSDQGAQGFRRLNIAGYHYAILNFLLLLVTVTAVMSFLRMFIETVRVGNNIRSESGKLPCKFADLRRNLSHFTEAYIVAKALCFIYILNIFTWNYSELVVTKDNLSMARGILAVMALFFISFPRYFVEYKWQQCRQLAPTADKDKYGEESIRNAGQVTLARIFDVVIWFCFLQSLLYEFIKPIWTDVLKLFDRFALWFQT